MEFNYFDLVGTIIILFLGIKGILNGFFKEVFGLIGIIGGVFIASRVGNQVGQYLSDMIFHFQNSSAVNFSGFLATLFSFWLLMLLAGSIFKKLSIMSGLGVVDKILGFIVGASKFFLIAAIIANAVYNINSIKTKVDKYMSNSVLFPILVETGGFIMKLDPVKGSELLKQKQEEIKNSTKKITENLKEEMIKSAMQKQKVKDEQ